MREGTDQQEKRNRSIYAIRIDESHILLFTANKVTAPDSPPNELMKNNNNMRWLLLELSQEDGPERDAVQRNDPKLACSNPKLARSYRLATYLFECLSLTIPSRQADEEIGDALEVISSLDSRWKIWLKTVSTVFWLFVNALREVTSALYGKPAPK
jgi:hypothetical protein